MKIGISGAGGHLGQKALSYLVRQGARHHLVGISRSPDTISEEVERRFGDYDRPESLQRAYEGLDRLLIIPSAELAPGVRGRQLRAAIDAAQHAGVAHVVLMSAAGTHEESAPSLGEAYWAGEQALLATASRWTILRMNYYAESMAEEIKMSLGSGVLAGLGEERVAYVSRDDVAAAAAGVLLSDGHAGATYNLTGPAVITGEERAAALSEVLQQSVNYVRITVEQLRAGLVQAGLPDPIVDALTEIKTTFVEGKFDIVTGDVERLSGRAPKSLRAVLVAELA